MLCSACCLQLDTAFHRFTIFFFFMCMSFMFLYLSPGRGMNAAFAIGRLLDMSPGKERLLQSPESDKMVMFYIIILIMHKQ